LKNEETILTDSAFNIIYSNNVNFLTDRVIKENSDYRDLNFFSISDKDGVSYNHLVQNKSFYVLVMASDISRLENLKELRNILMWSTLFSICLSVLFSYLFSSRAIRPISEIIRNVKEINSLKLGNRLDEGNKRDEIDQLAITFNEMLTNLEIVFKNQEDFVSNASHELRTPLTIMIGETDYFLSRSRDAQEYNNHLSGLVDDLKKLNELLNSLLELAQINKEHTIQMSKVRIDEIVYEAIHQVKPKYPGRKIIPRIQYPENEDDLIVSGNPGLLSIAFKNLIDNGCKFSDDDVIIEFSLEETVIKISISDSGIGIPADELESIYRPFKRASNVKFKSGFGIGLSLVAKIFELHDVSMNVQSVENEGTQFQLVFKKNILRIN